MLKKHPRMRNTQARQPLAVSVLLHDSDFSICECEYKSITTFDYSRPSIDLARKLLVGKMNLMCREAERSVICSGYLVFSAMHMY